MWSVDEVVFVKWSAGWTRSIFWVRRNEDTARVVWWWMGWGDWNVQLLSERGIWRVGFIFVFCVRGELWECLV